MRQPSLAALAGPEGQPAQNKKPIVSKKNNKKITPTPIVIEEPIVVEEKTEDEDLSQWLKEHTED